jgi:hypothetical protein
MRKDDISDVENSVDNDTSSDDEIEKKKVSKEFQENVIKYVKIDDLLDKKKTEMAELKKQLKPCEEYISKHLEKIGEKEIDITNGKIKRVKSEKPSALNMELIKETLLTKIKDPKEVDELLQIMDIARPINKTVSIKRTRNKTKKEKLPKKKPQKAKK